MSANILDERVNVSGVVGLRPFFDCRKMKELLAENNIDPGSNWLNQMKILGYVLGDDNARLNFDDKSMHQLEVNIRKDEVNALEDRVPNVDFVRLLGQLVDSGIVVKYELVLSSFDDDVAVLNHPSATGV